MVKGGVVDVLLFTWLSFFFSDFAKEALVSDDRYLSLPKTSFRTAVSVELKAALVDDLLAKHIFSSAEIERYFRIFYLYHFPRKEVL